MSNYCEILIIEDFDFGVDKKEIIEYLKENNLYQWDEIGYINISFSKKYWKDVINSLVDKFGWFFDMIYVKNDCIDEGGIFCLNGNGVIEKYEQ